MSNYLLNKHLVFNDIEMFRTCGMKKYKLKHAFKLEVR